MADSGRDQADGLRRLFRRPAPATIAFLGGRPRCGTTRVASVFARGLAGRGVSVTLVDEHRGEAGAAALLKTPARFDLWQVVNGDALVSQAVVLAGEGLRLVPAARLAQQRDALDPAQQTRFEQCWRAVCEGTDVVVIDASAASFARLSALGERAGALVLVSGTDSAAVMGAYLMLKQIVPARPGRRLGVVVNRSLDGIQASGIADNLGSLLRDQLGRGLDCFGWLPRVPAECDGHPGLDALDSLLPVPLRRPAIDSTDQAFRSPFGGLSANPGCQSPTWPVVSTRE